MNKLYGKFILVLIMSAGVIPPAVAQKQQALATHSGSFIQQGGTTQTETPWEKFSPKGSGFEVLFPGKPTGSDEALDTAVGTLMHHQYSLLQGTSYFMVSYVDYPGPVTDPTLIKTMLDAGREGGLKATNGVLRSEKEIKLGEYVGREWVVVIPDGGVARARAYWVSSRLYQAVVLIPETKDVEAGKLREATMSKFLDSFVLTADGVPRQ